VVGDQILGADDREQFELVDRVGAGHRAEPQQPLPAVLAEQVEADVDGRPDAGMVSPIIANLIEGRAAESLPLPSCRLSKRSGPALGQALAIFLPGIGSASAARHSGAPNSAAKYCVSCTTCPWANSIVLTE